MSALGGKGDVTEGLPRHPHCGDFGWSGSLLILGLYNFVVCLVAAVLFVVVNNLEPNRRLASALKIAIVAVAVAAILAQLMR
jgi:hypothetical protein